MNKLYWNEKFNYLAILELEPGRLPKATILDEEYGDTNPVFLYPERWLAYYGWVDLGELK